MDIDAHFIKSQDFRTVNVDGIFGGLMGSGLINVNLFTERLPLPTKIIIDVQPDGTATEKHREGKVGVIREVHMGIMINRTTAESVIQFLQNCIAKHDEMVAASNPS